MTVAITRLDLSTADLRATAARTQDAKAARRMLAIALVLARCCMNRLTAASSRRRVSNDPNGDRHTERRHPVEGIASDLRFGSLIAQSPSVKTPTDDGFVSRHCGFSQAAAIVA
jgi:hypothetical protein